MTAESPDYPPGASVVDDPGQASRVRRERNAEHAVADRRRRERYAPAYEAHNGRDHEEQAKPVANSPEQSRVAGTKPPYHGTYPKPAEPAVKSPPITPACLAVNVSCAYSLAMPATASFAAPTATRFKIEALLGRPSIRKVKGVRNILQVVTQFDETINHFLSRKRVVG